MENNKIKEVPGEMSNIKGKYNNISSLKSFKTLVFRGGNKNRLILGVLILIIIVFSVNFVKTQRELAQLRTPEGQQTAAQREIEEVVRRIQKHILVPEGELPVMATVVDAEELIREQPFYRGAQDGDKVLLYLEIQRAIIYSPERDIIVNVGPLILEN